VDTSREEMLATYTHLLKELSTLNIAYVHVCVMQRWFATFDPALRGTPEDFLLWRSLFTAKDGSFLANGDVSLPEGAQLLPSGGADAVVSARHIMSMPDLLERLTVQPPLPPNVFNWLTAYVPDPQGYTDYKRWADMSAEERVSAGRSQRVGRRS